MRRGFRRAALLGSVAGMVAALAPVAPAGAANSICVPIAPAVTGTGQRSVVVSVTECTTTHGTTGFRVYAYPDGASEPDASVDVPVGERVMELDGLSAGSTYRFRVATLVGTTAGARSAATGPVPLPYPTIEALAQRSFTDLLGAPPSSAQLALLYADLGTNPPAYTPQEMIDALLDSDFLARQAPVIRLYSAYFLRLPDPGGLRYWAARSRAGLRINRISSYFAASSEFTRRYGDLDDRGFVDRIYENVLGRPGDPAGVTYWAHVLDARAKDRGEVMVGFSESSEYQRKQAEVVELVTAFVGLLDRLPTPEEIDTWAPLPRLELVDAIYRSDEYASRVHTIAPPKVTPREVPYGAIGHPYPATTFTATFGRPPYRWRGADLPKGLTVSPDGVLSGTPTVKGPFEIGILATDADGRTGARGFVVQIHDFVVTPDALAQGTVGVPYHLDLSTLYASGDVWWNLEGGPLPTGMTFSSSGTFSGTPTVAKTVEFQVTAHDAEGHEAPHFYRLTVVPAPAPAPAHA